MAFGDDVEKAKPVRKSRWGDISDSDSEDSDDDTLSSKVITPINVTPPEAKHSTKPPTAKTTASHHHKHKKSGHKSEDVSQATSVPRDGHKHKIKHTEKHDEKSENEGTELVVVGRKSSKSKLSVVDIEPVNLVPLFEPITTLFFLNAVEITMINGVPMLVCASSNCDLDALDMKTGHTAIKFEGHVDRVISFAVSPSPPASTFSDTDTQNVLHTTNTKKYTQYIAAGACDDSIAIWEMVGNEPKQLHGIKAHNGSVWSIRIYIDPVSMAAFVFSAGNEGLIKVWHLRSGKRVNSFKGHVGKILTLFILQKNNLIAPATTGAAAKFKPSGHSNSKKNASIHYSSAKAGNGESITDLSTNMLFSGGQDKVLRVWDMFSGSQRKQFTGHTSDIHCIKAFYSTQHRSLTNSVPGDDIVILSSGMDNTIRIWSYNNSTPLHVLQGHVGCVYGVDYDIHPNADQDKTTCAYPPMTVYSCSADGTVRTWDIADGALLQVNFKKAHLEGVRSIDVKKGVYEEAPSQVIVATCSWDKVLKVQNAQEFEKNVGESCACVIS